MDFDSDHRIFSINFRVLAPAKQYWGRQTHVTETKRIPRLNVSNLSRNDTVDQYNQLLLDMTRADLVSDVDLWQYAARRAGEKFCGDQVGPARPAWQEDNSEELAQLASQKQQAYRRSRSDPTTIPLYKALVRMHKHRVRQILNEWWANKAAEIQAEVDTKSPNYQYAGYRQLRKTGVQTTGAEWGISPNESGTGTAMGNILPGPPQCSLTCLSRFDFSSCRLSSV